MRPPGMLRPPRLPRLGGARGALRRGNGLLCTASFFLSIVLLRAVQGTAETVWDAAFTVSVNPFPATSALTLENVDMQQALLYPPNSSFPFMPAVYQAPAAAASLGLFNCSIHTICSSVQAYALFTGATSSTSPDSSSSSSSSAVMLSNTTLYISTFTSTSLTFNATLINTTISCSSDQAVPAAQASASSAPELLAALNALGTLSDSAGNALQLQGFIQTNYSAGWPVDGASVGPGMLTITSAPGSRAILDAAMNVNTIKAPTGPIHISNLTLVNLCTSRSVVQGFTFYSSYGLAALYRPELPWGESNTTNKPLVVRDSTIMVPRFEMASLMYWCTMYPGPFDKVNAYAAVFVSAYPNNPPVGYAISADRLEISLIYNSLIYTDVIMHATDVPPPPEAQGATNLPPTLCSAGAGPKALLPTAAMQDDSLNPLYAVQSAQGLMAALQAAATRRLYYPPVLLLFGGYGIDASASGLTFGFDVIITGPTTRQSTVGSPENATLDLGQMQQAAISLKAELFLQRLTVINPRESNFSTPSGLTGSSALPLWGFQFDRSNGTRIFMDSVTLVLPVASFAPLYALAKSGGPSKLAAARLSASTAWPPLMHQVLDGITIFTVTRYNVSNLVVSRLEGWGMNATNLLILPAAPYYDDQPQSSPGSDGSGSDTVRFILIVVLTIFGALLLIFVAAFWYRRRCSKPDAPPPEPKAVDAAPVSACCPTADPEIGGITSSSSSVCGANPKSITTDGPSSAGWDPMKEVQQFAGLVQAKEEDSLQLLEPIGTGGFGTVYHGRWRNLDVAVKTVLFTCKDGRNDAPERQAIKEAAVCSSIIHPNVVATYHYDIRPVQAMVPEGAMPIQDHVQPRDWKMYLVQELCHSSLADALASSFFHHQDTNLPKLDLILSTLLDVSKGLEYIHGKNIIHGDLKPENVLLRVDPSSPHGVISKITDLGLCSTLDPSRSHVSCFNGTPFYAAPEIAATGKTTKLSDVFSFGILMVEVYRRETPWVRTPQGFHPNESFLVFHEKVPAAYLSLVDRCLQQDPKKRPELTQIREALEVMLVR